jgi:hypothetical protein
MHQVIDKLVEVFTTAPGLSVPAGQIGLKKPANGSELPAVSVALTLEVEKSQAPGRFIRSGDGLAKSRSVVEVNPTEGTFSPGLKSLRIAPLPLRKNPASTGRAFSENDLQISNVTNPANPVPYRLIANPTRKDEFKLDAVQALVEFGSVQTMGERLEIVHWTVVWRDEIRCDRYIGSMALEVWANNFNQVDQVARGIHDVMRAKHALLREKGFLKLHPLGIEPADHLLLTPPAGTALPVWRQKLIYTFAFEAAEGGDLSSSIPIKQINVEMGDHLVETFTVR